MIRHRAGLSLTDREKHVLRMAVPLFWKSLRSLGTGRGETCFLITGFLIQTQEVIAWRCRRHES